jgi:hypothetical protein
MRSRARRIEDPRAWSTGPRRRWRPRSRARGCLLTLLLLIVILIVLAVAFSGFQKGTKTGAMNNAASRPGYSAAAFRGQAAGLQPRVNGLRFQREDGEDAFVDAPGRLAPGQPVQGLQAQRVLA